MKRTTTFVAVAVLALGLAGCSRDEATLKETQAQIQKRLEAGRRAGRLDREIRTFYERAGHSPAWLDGRTPTARADRLLEALQGASRHGLDPRSYDVDGLRTLRDSAKKEGWLGSKKLPKEVLGEADVRFTTAFFRYASHLLQGRIEPRRVDPEWLAHRRQADLIAVLEQARDSGDVQGALDGLAPKHPGYARLMAAREQGGDTERMKRIDLNLERWRWLPDDLGESHVLVNVPAYDVRLVQQGRETTRMRAIVGDHDNRTPIFSDTIDHVTFNPNWNVPESILSNEIVPKLEEDETYLERNDMEIVKDGQVVSPDEVDLSDPTTFALRQRPGEGNALGRVKFVFPNPFNVYLHDTPQDALFARKERALSHGCVRLERPLELAERVLSDQPKWTRAAIEEAIAGGAEKSVKLARPLPVHLVYWTAWVEEDGSVQLADDVYGYDAAQAARVAQLSPRPTQRAGR